MFRRTALQRWVLSLGGACSILLAACGGGGGAETEVQPPPVSAPGPVAAPAPTPAPQPSPAQGTWVVMGSSTAAGAAASPGKSWSNLLQTALSGFGARIENIAKGGAVTYHGLSSSAAAVSNRPAPDPESNIDRALSRNPVVLVVAYPTNDTALGYSVDESVNNILSIRAAALAKGVAVVVLSTQPRNLSASQLESLHQIDLRLRASVGGCFVDIYTRLAGADGRMVAAYNSGDGIHPNDLGHNLIAETILKTLNSGSCIKL